jgi:hypothetical protein
MEQAHDINLQIKLWSGILTFIICILLTFSAAYILFRYVITSNLIEETSKIIFEPILRTCLAK